MNIDLLHGGTSLSPEKLRSGSSAAMDIKKATKARVAAATIPGRERITVTMIFMADLL